MPFYFSLTTDFTSMWRRDFYLIWLQIMCSFLRFINLSKTAIQSVTNYKDFIYPTFFRSSNIFIFFLLPSKYRNCYQFLIVSICFEALAEKIWHKLYLYLAYVARYIRSKPEELCLLCRQRASLGSEDAERYSICCPIDWGSWNST